MMAFLGFASQYAATGKGPIDNLVDHVSDPFHNVRGPQKPPWGQWDGHPTCGMCARVCIIVLTPPTRRPSSPMA